MTPETLLSYALGIPSLDEDHLRILQKMEQAAKLTNLEEARTVVFTELLAHFEKERVMLDQHCYPLYAEHVADHQSIIDQFSSVIKNGTLRELLLAHVKHHDLPYAHFLHSNDVFKKTRFHRTYVIGN